ncbi:MAG: FAD-dependent oxidoreductase [Candidatus Caenarcaniphilales bacterium]|nr:FAD-dependent oxidoreductase [Candidatus Caenarcaniphilales bacterium]
MFQRKTFGLFTQIWTEKKIIQKSLFFLFVFLNLSLLTSCNKQEINIEKENFEITDNTKYDVLVYGNELPAIAAAVYAKRVLGKDGKVVLVRRNTSTEPFGGLLTQGGLAYLDRNQVDKKLTPSSEFYKEFLKKAKVKVVSADPVLVDRALKEMLQEERIAVLHNSQLHAILKNGLIDYLEVIERPLPADEAKQKDRSKNEIKEKSTNKIIKAHSYIDATANADLAMQMGLKYSIGFETLGFPDATLPVTPVFQTKGLSVKNLQRIEKSILNNKPLMKEIKDKIEKEHDPEFANWLLKKIDLPMYVGPDYIDVRSIAICVAYHLYRGKPFDFKHGFLFDRPNIAILREGNLAWNAFLYKFSSKEVMDIIQNGSKPSIEMIRELDYFADWLNSFSENNSSTQQIATIPPLQLYIRHSHNIIDVKKPLTGRQMVEGGTNPKESVGTFSYYMDIRGGIDGYHGTMPKPTFNFGIEHALTQIPNLSVVGRCSGYYGLAPAAGRILELNTSIGSYVGAAAALAHIRSSNPISRTHSSESLKEQELINKETYIHSITSSEARKAIEKLTHKKVILQPIDLSKTTDLENII